MHRKIIQLLIIQLFDYYNQYQVCCDLLRDSSPLNGQHLRIIPRNVVSDSFIFEKNVSICITIYVVRFEQHLGFISIMRNSSGFIQEISGYLPDMLDVLAKHNNFTLL